MSGCPDPVGDQLGLEGVDEALSDRVVVGVADRADRREDVVIVERLGVVDRGVLGGFNRSSQRFAFGGIVDARRALRRVCASRVSCVVCC